MRALFKNIIDKRSRKLHGLPVLALALLALVACVGERNGLDQGLLKEARVVEFDSSFIRIWGDAKLDEINIAELSQAPELKIVNDPVNGKRRQDFLVLSGGGAKGAFGAGLLNGWTTSGVRPEFSVVTGVSTGAIIAPFAFLGSKYDHLLTEFYTTYSTKDLVRIIGLGGVLGGSSAASSKPLERLIAKYVTPEVLRAVATEYQSGRYLLVGTTNLDAQRPVIWNMGEIARQGNEGALKLFRRVILASISIPGAFPPVLIDVRAGGKVGKELHVDGGTTDNAFLAPVQLRLKNVADTRSKGVTKRIFVVVNSNLAPKAEIVKASTINITARSIDTLIKQQTGGDVLRLYDYSRDNDIQFNYLEIPDEFDVQPKELFDPVYMKALYKLGVKTGLANNGWKKAPRELQ
ncbi:MAG: patatin-like phospholipase family protein [Pseudomonadota bacterium]